MSKIVKKKITNQTDGYHLDSLTQRLSPESTAFEFMKERNAPLKISKGRTQYFSEYIVLCLFRT